MQKSKQYWDKIYKTKNPNEVSWTQEVPKTSLDFIHSFNLKKDAKIIDVGGGDSKLVDFLLSEGFVNITVLDISSEALDKTKFRLGENAKKVKWVVSDITQFQPDTRYDVWHDRAAFHFLTKVNQISSYVQILRKSVSGYLIMGTFSEKGPEKCSGLNIKQYSEKTLTNELNKGFDKIRCIEEEHITPFGSQQNFLFCSFKRN